MFSSDDEKYTQAQESLTLRMSPQQERVEEEDCVEQHRTDFSFYESQRSGDDKSDS